MKSQTLKIIDNYLTMIEKTNTPKTKLRENTLSLIDRYLTILEQGESPPVEDPAAAPDPNAAPPEGAEAPVEEAPPEDDTPETTVAENEYVEDLVNASLFKPSMIQQNVLLNLQNIMADKKYNNARMEILPYITQMIYPNGKQEEPPQNNPDPENTIPLTPEGEDQYISDLIDAALFEPSSEDATTLLDLQSVMKVQRYTNSREEILPTVLSIIGSSTQAGDLKQNISDLGNI